MNNQEVRQISDEDIRQELTKEELQKTQVLNFQELQETVKLEKKAHRSPAVLVAVIGIISILFGGSLQIANILNIEPQGIQKRDTKQNTKIEIKELNCTKTSLNNTDGTNTIYKIVYNFENKKLVGFTKEYSISATPGKEEGKKSIEKYSKEYESLLNEIPGYKIKINTTSDTTMSIKVVVDYKKLDLTKLNEIQKTKPFTKVDYYRNASYYTIKSETIGDGFTVE